MTATLALPGPAPRVGSRQLAARRQARRRLFWRRRLVVLALSIAVVAAVVLSTQGVQADDGSAPSTGEPVRYVVQPGDSLWSIAEDLAPDADPRPVVHRLERSVGSAALQIGQVVVIPADLAG